MTAVSAPPDILSILVIADHDVVREGLVALLMDEPDLVVAGEADHRGEILSVIRRQDVDVVVVDHDPPMEDGLAICRLVRSECLDVRVVLVAEAPETLSIGEALREGASALLARDGSAASLVSAVRGAVTPSPEHAGPNPAGPSVVRIAPSQLAVLRRLVEGNSVADIAEATGLSHHTVRSYLRDLYRRLGVSSRAEAAAVALRSGLV
jgi:two-component system, NarL family, response regulator DevR